MDMTSEAAQFRDEVRAFMAETVQASWLKRVQRGLRLKPDELRAYQAALHKKGWGAPTWPVEFGGTGWTPSKIYLFEKEASLAGAPMQFHQGLELIGPIIFTYGSDEQKAKYLPRIVSGEDWWCQGYSEPGAGSDLAGLRTSARREGDHYVLNGQKTWTSYAHVATHMFVLARTSKEDKRQNGISLFLIDMDSSGLEIRPIRSMEEIHHVNEVFLDEVHVPVENLVGTEGMGWQYGKVLLDRERIVAASSAIHITQIIDGVREAIHEASESRQRDLHKKLVQIEIQAMALETMARNIMSDAERGVDSGPRGSMVKLRWSQIYQEAMNLLIEALGTRAARFRGLSDLQDVTDITLAMQGALYSRVTSIYGGSSEIQRTIIAKRSLGLG